MALDVKPISEGNRPGWTVEKGTRSYLLWAPRPEKTYPGLGSPSGDLVVKARAGWSAAWNARRGDDGDYWKADTLAEVLAPLPGEVEQAFREAAAQEGFNA